MMVTRREKAELTRLGNLLNKYRDHIITNRAIRFDWVKPHKIVDEVDKSITVLKQGLKERHKLELIS